MKQRTIYTTVVMLTIFSLLMSSVNVYAQDNSQQQAPLKPYLSVFQPPADVQSSICTELMPEENGVQAADFQWQHPVFLPLINMNDQQLQYCPVIQSGNILLDDIAVQTNGGGRARWFGGFTSNVPFRYELATSLRPYSSTITTAAMLTATTSAQFEHIATMVTQAPAQAANVGETTVVGPVFTEFQKILNALNAITEERQEVLAFLVYPTDLLNTSAYPTTASLPFGNLCPGTSQKQALYLGTIPGVDLNGHLHFWSFFHWANGNLPCRNAYAYVWVDESQMQIILNRPEHKRVLEAARTRMETNDYILSQAQRFWVPDGSSIEFPDTEMETLTWGQTVTIGFYTFLGGVGYYFFSVMRTVPIVP